MRLLKSNVNVNEFERQAIYYKKNGDLTSCIKIRVYILKEEGVSRQGNMTMLNPFSCMVGTQEIPFYDFNSYRNSN